jgi:ActR/RegA family two-component response regulator
VKDYVTKALAMGHTLAEFRHDLYGTLICAGLIKTYGCKAATARLIGLHKGTIDRWLAGHRNDYNRILSVQAYVGSRQAKELIGELFSEVMSQAMRLTEHNQTETAKLLQCNRQTIRKYLYWEN